MRWLTGFCLAVLAATALAQEAAPYRTVRLVRATLTDNGDGDAWADTRETVTLDVTIVNRTGQDLTGVRARLETDDPHVCVLDAVIDVGAMAQREERSLEGAFTFFVGDVERGTIEEELTATFRLIFWADGHDELPGPAELIFDLDLDATGGAGPTTFFESFEDGFNQFSLMELDRDLNPPDDDLDNHEAGLIASDGYRCQYSDPDWHLSAVFNYESRRAECYPSPTGAPDAAYWGPTSDRGFSGTHAMHYGIYLDAARGFTEPFGQLEAVATTDPINLAAGSVCSDSRVSCANDADCTAAESCVAVAPTLSFLHQVSFYQQRTQKFLSRGAVMVQEADADGNPVGDWVRVVPFHNPYTDNTAFPDLPFCTFDPVDDGNTEEDFFDPDDPGRILGPSTTCYPALTFGNQGFTGPFFNPQWIGYAADGPGQSGEHGDGTWVEARIDLGRWRGKRVRARFLATGMKSANIPHVEAVYQLNPDPRDDGWFIDDVQVTDTLTTPLTLAVDAKPNDELPSPGDPDADGMVCPDNCRFVSNPDQADADGDGRGDACDPCPTDPFDDSDEDGWCCLDDTCCVLFDPGQEDADGDRLGDLCDNCPLAGNVEQVDTDGDTRGDACDECPVDPDVGDPDADAVDDACDNCVGVENTDQAETDGDAVGNACDNCPSRFNPAQNAAARISDGGAVSTAVASPDGSWLVYATGSTVYGQPTAGGLPLPIAMLPHGHSVATLAVTPDSATVVFNQDEDPDPQGIRIVDVFSVPIDGSAAPVSLDPAVRDLDPGFTLSPDGSRVVFEVAPPLSGLYSVPVGGGPVARLDIDQGHPGFVVDFTPDGQTVVYLASAAGCSCADDFDDELYAVPIDGGPVYKLSHLVLPGVEDVVSFAVSPNGVDVLYATRGNQAGNALYRTTTTGGPTLLEPQDVGTFGFAGDAETVILTIDVGQSFGLYTLPLEGGDTTLLNTLGGNVTWWTLLPDGETMLYQVRRTSSVYSDELRLVSVGGGAEQVLDSGYFIGPVVVSPDGTRTVTRSYWNDGTALSLIRVSLTGEPTVRLNVPLETGTTLDAWIIDPTGAAVAYTVGAPGALQGALYVVPIDGGTAVRLDQASDQTARTFDDFDFAGGPDQLFYVADERYLDLDELFLARLEPNDADGDGVVALCDCDESDPAVWDTAPERNDGRDNQCPGDAGFGLVDETSDARFDSPEVLAWQPQIDATEYEVVRATEPQFTSCDSWTVAEPRLVIIEVPPPSVVFFYLARARSPFPGSFGASSSGMERFPACGAAD